ncbi:acyltransferase [Propionispira raffinosivorans]|uniref:acyltransferase n=1 Tax=Propionispira raffinosivorans TaxID=86959 RepID=UPI000380605B|nr:acyltransferase [Propionispira raffinosivorans]
MIKFMIKAYQYGNHFGEKIARLKTIFWYQHFFGKVGMHCVIFKPLRLINPQNIYICDTVRIYKDSRIETIEKWGDVKFHPKITIGEGTSIEQRLHLICAEKVEIGANVVLSADVMITDNNHEYKEINRNIMQQSLLVKETVIGDYCFVGMGTKVMPGTKLGKNCIVGANSVVMGEFPDYSVLAGSPARIIKRYDFEVKKWRRTNNRGVFLNDRQ